MQDLRLAVRNLLRRPAFSLIAVITLALGIGANTAVFSVANAVLLAPLPYHRPEAIVILHEFTPELAMMSVTRYNYEAWRARAESFVDIAAYRPTQVTATGAGEPERVPAKMITATLLPLLGVEIGEGRNFTRDEDRAGAPAVAILSANFAARMFAGQSAIGQKVQLDAETYTIVGIMPREFELFQPAEIYMPFWPWAATLPEDRGWHPGIFPVARLKDGVTLEQARVEMDGISRQLESEYPESNKNVRARLTRAQDVIVQNVSPALTMLMGAVALVLLIACANVANLLLVRAVDRRKEMALRFALGASRVRIVRQLLVESLLLACVGGAAGLLVASWAVSFLTGTTAAGLPRAQNIAVDWPIVLFALGLSIFTGIVFGLFPALQAVHVPIRDSLNEEGRGRTGGVQHRRLRSALVVSEVSLALVLLVVAGLFLRSFATLVQVPPGFQPENLLVVNLPISPQRYADSFTRTAFVNRLIDRVRALPGVRSAGITTALPMAGPGATIHFNREAYPPKGPDDYVFAGYRAVTPDYLPTLRVPLRRGRMLSRSDDQDSPPVVVINESLARQYFPDRNPLGERIQLGTEPSPDLPAMEIVGVVGDAKQSFHAGAKAEMFVPYAQQAAPILTGMYLDVALVVRTDNNPQDLTSWLRAAVREIDPGQPLVNVRTMEHAIAGTVAQPRMQLALLVIFGTVAVALAAVGVYGVMAYTVTQRIPEIAIRIAVGASPAQVVRMVVWQGAQLALAGVALGAIASALAATAMQSLLFEVKGLDPLTFVVAPLMLGVAALLASYIPARRAAHISPLLALGR